MIPNLIFTRCINSIQNGPKTLEQLDIVYEKSDYNFIKHDSVFYYEPDVKNSII